MAGTYVPINLEEMHSLLSEQGFAPLVLQGTVEVVYSKVVAPQVCMRIYTSVAHGTSRGVGEDAIRCCLVARLSTGEIKGIGSTSRVYRLANWRGNLLKRIEMWTRLMGPACQHCGAHTVARSGKYGDFWGCVRYPECRGVVKDHRQELGVQA